MHGFFNVIFGAFVRLLGWTSDLADALAGLVHRAAAPGDIMLATIVVASLLVCLLGCAWAFIERGRAATARYMASNQLARAQSEIRFREAVIQAVPEAIVIMGADLASPVSYRGGSALLQACLAGPDSTALAAKLDALLETGQPFLTDARTARHSFVSVQGSVVGSRAALFLSIENGASELDRALKGVLETMPAPVWIRDKSLDLVWANRAFLAATGSASLDAARETNPQLVRTERDLVSAALEGRDVVGERRYTMIDGRRRALSMDLTRLAGAQVAGFALDVTDTAQGSAQLTLAADAQADMLDHMTSAVAVFGADRKLASFNAVFARLWDLPQAWLESRPTLEDIFDRLRETRRLPEQRDFPAWRRTHLAMFETGQGELDETWHVAGGASIRVRAYPHRLGGVYYVFEDIGEMLRLSTSLHMLTAVQRATLDTLGDGVAIFGPDGRLKMHNDAFAELWRFTEDELAAEPHMARVAALSATKIGRDSVWSMVSSGVTSGEPQRFGQWGRVTRADGRILSVALTRLPLGATLVVFEDLTDVERFNAAMRDGGESGVAVA
jgi:PAS domain-containing protein